MGFMLQVQHCMSWTVYLLRTQMHCALAIHIWRMWIYRPGIVDPFFYIGILQSLPVLEWRAHYNSLDVHSLHTILHFAQQIEISALALAIYAPCHAHRGSDSCLGSLIKTRLNLLRTSRMLSDSPWFRCDLSPVPIPTSAAPVCPSILELENLNRGFLRGEKMQKASAALRGKTFTEPSFLKLCFASS